MAVSVAMTKLLIVDEVHSNIPMSDGIRDQITAGVYDNPLEVPWGDLKTNPEGFGAYSKVEDGLIAKFKADALEEVGLTDHPKADRIWDKAWDERADEGIWEVFDELEELADLIR